MKGCEGEMEGKERVRGKREWRGRRECEGEERV